MDPADEAAAACTLPRSTTPALVPTAGPPAQSRFQAFVDSVFDAYYDWHIRTGYMEFSAQIDALLGLPPGRAAARLRGLAGPPAPRRPRAPPWRPWTTAVREGGVYRDEYRMRRDDGTYVQVQRPWRGARRRGRHRRRT